ncbi:restriction endonuclease subunit S [Staphylococcus cohnii]
MYGIGASATEFDGENVYVRITDINETSRKLNKDKLTSPDKLDKKYLLNENDVLFARTGASTGKTYIHTNYDRDKNYYFAGFLIKFEFKNNYLANFIFQNTLTKRFENWVSVMSVRSGQPGINSEEYGKLKMRFPSKVEQNKIGDFFSKLDRQIELEEQKLAKLEEQKKGYMQQIFSQELRFKDENGNDYPEWEKVKIKEIFSEIESGNRLPKTNLISGEIPYVIAQTTNNGVHKKIDKNTLDYHHNKMKLFNEGSITISIDNPEALFIQERSFFTSNVMRVLHNDNLSREAHIFIMLSLKALTQSYNWSVKFTGPVIMDSQIKFPVIKERQINWKIVNQIGKFLNLIEKRIIKQSEKIDKLRKRKQGFLQKMFV